MGIMYDGYVGQVFFTCFRAPDTRDEEIGSPQTLLDTPFESWSPTPFDTQRRLYHLGKSSFPAPFTIIQGQLADHVNGEETDPGHHF